MTTRDQVRKVLAAGSRRDKEVAEAVCDIYEGTLLGIYMSLESFDHLDAKGQSEGIKTLRNVIKENLRLE